MSDHIFVNDFEASQYVEGTYCAQNTQRGLTKNGKPFLKVLLSDNSGQVAARMWNLDDNLFNSLPENGFVYVSGHTQPFNEQLQLIIQSIRATDVSDTNLTDLLPASKKNISEMFERLKEIMGSLSHPAMIALARAYLEDETLMKYFRMAPAGVSLHHAYLGGVLEHTLQLLELAELMLPRYPGLNRDIVLTGLFLHDMAKARELKFDSAFSYTDEGHLLGHLVMGALWLQRKADQTREQYGQAVPRDALLVLHHILISHHGQPEYGAAKIPATPEAVFVSRLDELDAKTQMTIDAASRKDDSSRGLKSLQDGRFTEKQWALGTRLFRPDPLKA